MKGDRSSRLRTFDPFTLRYTSNRRHLKSAAIARKRGYNVPLLVGEHGVGGTALDQVIFGDVGPKSVRKCDTITITP